MKKLSLAVVIVSLAAAALSPAVQAQGRIFSPGLLCGDVANFVSLNGAAVVRTGGHTYDRYVAAQRYCARGETTKPAWVLSADNPQCFIGYTCEPVYGRGRR